jgi:hypothetical protein
MTAYDVGLYRGYEMGFQTDHYWAQWNYQLADLPAGFPRFVNNGGCQIPSCGSATGYSTQSELESSIDAIYNLSTNKCSSLKPLSRLLCNLGLPFIKNPYI